MASPRKFSEKIAQLAQRQAEGNAAFMQIMDDVKSAKQQTKPYRQALHPAPPYARSLPNVNQMSAAPANNIQIQFGDYQGLGGVDDRPDVGGPCRPREKKCGGMSPGSSRHSVRGSGSGTNLNWQSPYSRTTENTTIPVSVVTSSSAMSVRVERVPASQPFLSPPPFSEPWKRTYSDSALHTSVVGPNSPSFMAHCGGICVNDGHAICSPVQNHSSSASASPSPPSPSCHQHPGFDSPGSISIPCHTTQSPRLFDPDGEDARTVRIIRRESPQMMSLVQSVGCGADDPTKLMPDSSTSPSGSLPDLNSMHHIPPPLTTPLDVDPQTPVFRATVASIDPARKFSQPSVSAVNGSLDHSGVQHSSMGLDFESVITPDLFTSHPNFMQYRAPAEPAERDGFLDNFPTWSPRSTFPATSPIPIPKASGHSQIPFSCNQRSSSPGCDPHSAPASPSDASSFPGQRAVFVSELMSPVQQIDAYALAGSSPLQTQHVLRQFQRINMVDSSTGTSVSAVQPALVSASVPSIMSNANGAVEVTFSDEYSRLLQEAVAEVPTSAHQPLSSNHGIVITLTAPDSSEALSASLGISQSALDQSISDLPHDLSDIFGIDDYGATDSLRADLAPLDVDGLQLLMNPDNNITDAATEDHFRMDRL